MKNVSTVKTLLQTITMILIISSLFSTSLQAQAKGVVIGEDNLEQSAILELHSDNKGILIPRMSTLSRNAIPGAASGLFLFNTDNGIFNKRLSSGWTELDDDWTRRLTPPNNTATNDIYRLNGNVGIGTSNPTSAKLVINTTAGSTGLDMATADSYAEMRVIRNTLNSSDKNMYIGYAGPVGSSLYLYSDGQPTMRIQGDNVGIRSVIPGIDFNIQAKAGNTFGLSVEDQDGNSNLRVVNSGGMYMTRGSFSVADGNASVQGWGFSDVGLTIHKDTENSFSFLIRDDATNQLYVSNDGDLIMNPGSLSMDSGNIFMNSGGVTLNSGGLSVEGFSNFGRQVNIFDDVSNAHALTVYNNNSSATVWITAGGGASNYALNIAQGRAGKPGGGFWENTSDRRLKKDIVEYKEGLDFITKVNPVWYTYNGKGDTPEGARYIGIIAQDMQEIAPHMVSTFTAKSDDQEYLSFDGSAFTYMLINAVQEQQEQITAQETEINSLKSNYEKILRRLAALEGIRD